MEKGKTKLNNQEKKLFWTSYEQFADILQNKFKCEKQKKKFSFTTIIQVNLKIYHKNFHIKNYLKIIC